MPQYVMVYLGGDQPATPEEGQQHFAKFMAWLEALGDAVVSPANPLKDTCTIAADGGVSAGGSTGMSGYTILAADSMQAAQDMAKSCPFLEIGGSLELSELIEMPGAK